MSILDFVGSAEELLLATHDPAGTENTTTLGGLKVALVDEEFNLAAPARDVEIFEAVWGSTVVDATDELVESSFRMLVEPAAGYQDLIDVVRLVARILRDGGRLRWQPTGQLEPLFAPFETSPAPALYRGQARAIHRAVRQLREPEGLPIVVRRQALLLERDIDSAVNLLDNPTMIEDLDGDGRPDGWSWTLLDGISAESTSDEGYRFTIATAGTRNFRQERAVTAGLAYAGSVHAKAPTGATAQARAVLQYLDTAGTVLAEHLGDQFVLDAAEIRLEVEAPAAPTGTTKARLNVRFDNTSLDPNTVVLRLGQLEEGTVTRWAAGTLTVPNDPLAARGIVFPIYVMGDAEAPGKLYVKADTGAKIARILVGRTDRRVADYVNATKQAQLESSREGWTVTHYDGTIADEETATWPASGAQMVAFVPTDAVLKRKIRVERTTRLEALRGDCDIWVRVRPLGTGGDYRIQLRWAPSLGEAIHVEDEVPFDATDAVNAEYVFVRLGRIRIPEEVPLGGVAFEIWARRMATSASLMMDYTSHFWGPVSLVAVPPGSKTKWHGGQLVTPVANPAGGTAGLLQPSGKRLTLDAAGDNAGTPPDSGTALPAGRHRYTFRLRKVSSGLTSVVIRVRNITDSTDAATWTLSGGLIPTAGSADFRLEFDSAAGKLYEGQVDDPVGPGGSMLDIYDITHEFIPAITGGEQIHTDPERAEVERLDAAGGVLSPLEVAGPVPVELRPGLQAIALQYEDAPAPGYTDRLAVLARTPTVRVVYAPRRLA